jgi:hypothetical protein
MCSPRLPGLRLVKVLHRRTSVLIRLSCAQFAQGRRNLTVWEAGRMCRCFARDVPAGCRLTSESKDHAGGRRAAAEGVGPRVASSDKLTRANHRKTIRRHRCAVVGQAAPIAAAAAIPIVAIHGAHGCVPLPTATGDSAEFLCRLWAGYSDQGRTVVSRPGFTHSPALGLGQPHQRLARGLDFGASIRSTRYPKAFRYRGGP